MKLFNILIILILAFCSLNANQWNETAGPKKADLPLPTYTIQKISNKTFLVGTDGGGIYKTTNSGNTWTNVLDITDLVWTIAMKPNGILFAGTNQSGIYRSTNNGDTWNKILNLNSLLFDFNFDEDGNVYAACEGDGLYKSTNNGTNWSLIWSTDLVPTSVYVTGNNYYVGTITDGLYYSNDGVNFDNLEFSGDVVWDIISRNNKLYVCNELSGINVSEDGFSFSNYAFPTSSVWTYFVSSSNLEFLIVDATDIYRYSDIDNQWITFNGGLEFMGATDLDEDSEGYMLASTLSSAVFRTAVSTFPPSIKTLSSVQSEYCAGEFFTMEYTVEGGFEPNNNFQIQLSDENGSFENPITIGFQKSQVGGSMDVVIPFDEVQGANYRIRIISTHPSIIGPSTSFFIVNELNTMLLSPVHQVIDVDLKPTFNWNANDCALSYSLQISQTPNFSDIDFQIDGLSNNSYTIQTNLDKGTTYYWRVGLLSILGDERFTDVFSFTTVSSVTQQISLNTGWNWVSSYITLDDMNIENFLSSISNNILIVKNQAGAVYIPDFEINNIGNWVNSAAYQIYMKSAQTLELTGNAIVPETYVINLNTGWNRIAYLRNSGLSAETAFASITDNDNLLIAKNFGGQVYIPSFGINTIGNLVPGAGYMLYLNNSDSFSYPAN